MKKLKLIYFVLLLFATIFSAFAQEKEEIFVLNLDWMHFYQSRTEAHMNMAHVEAFIDQYAGGKVTHLFFNPNAQRASFRSNTRESVWDPVPGIPLADLHNTWREAKEYPGAGPLVAKALYEKGIDPYAVWVKRSREKGISPWLTIRMNDVHHAPVRSHFFHSEFWRSNPDLWRIPNYTGDSWNDYALDFAHQAVRDYQLSFVKELLERYEPDGIELDWLRFPYHLKAGRYREDAHYIDKFVSDVRKMLNESGRDIGLSVRVPSFPDAAEGLGLNAAHWAREGWIDMIVASPFFGTTDYNIRLDLWQERLGEAAEKVRLLACFEFNTRAFFPAASTSENQRLTLLYGFVENARYRGANGIYLFNWFDGGPNSNPQYRKLLADGIGAEIIKSRERRFPVTYRDIVPPGVSNDVQLPKETDVEQSIRIMMGGNPQDASVFLILGFEGRDGLETSTFSASLNGKDLGSHEEENDLMRLGSAPQRAVKFHCPPEALIRGENVMTLKQTAGTQQRLVWVELRVNETDLHHYEPNLRDRLWMWGHESITISGRYNIPEGSVISQADAIDYLGIPNLHVVRYQGKPEYPFDDFIKQFSNTKRVSWSILELTQPEETMLTKRQWGFELIDKMPNLMSFCLDDLFHEKLFPPLSEIQELRKEIDKIDRKFSLSAVLYSLDLEKDINLKEYLDYFDEVLFWTWHATELVKLEENFNKYREIAPDKPTWLGIYMWDFGNQKPITIELMKLQLDFALEKFKQGQIEGLIFHCTPLVDLGLEAVEYSRQWIAEHGDVTRE